MVDHDEDVEHDDDSDPKALVNKLRKQLRAAQSEVKRLRPLERGKVMGKLGIDPESRDGRLFVELAEAKGIDFTEDALRTFAAERDLDVRPAAEVDDEPVVERPQGQSLPPDRRERADAQSRIDRLNTAGAAYVPPTVDDAIREAEQAGDTRTSISLKRQKWEAERAKAAAS